MVKRVVKTVEFIGLCGAGKTYMQKRLIPKIETRLEIIKPGGVDVFHAYTETIKIITRSFFIDPRRTIGFLSAKTSWWLLFKLGYRSAQLKKYMPTELTLLVDGGLIQPIISFCIERSVIGMKIPFGLLLLSLGSLPSLIIYIKVSPQTALKRYMEREWAVNGTLEKFERAYNICENIKEICKIMNLPVLELDNED